MCSSHSDNKYETQKHMHTVEKNLYIRKFVQYNITVKSQYLTVPC